MHVSGLEEDIQNLSSENISGSLDVSYLPIGIHEVELLIDLDDSKYSYQPVKVRVYITDPTMIESEESEETQDSENAEESETQEESESQEESETQEEIENPEAPQVPGSSEEEN